MKILVFDDSEIHRETALLTLKGHDLKIVGTYDDAQAALKTVVGFEKLEKVLSDLLQKNGLASDFNPYKGEVLDEHRKLYWNLWSEAREIVRQRPDFDVVLTDLFVPASSQAMGPKGKRFIGQEMPLGTTIALLAICAGVKNVAVVTDGDHHDHPAIAAFDCFSGCDAQGVKLICTNRPDYTAIDSNTGEVVDRDFLDSQEGLVAYPPNPERTGRQGLKWIPGKNWKKVLDRLLRSGLYVAEGPASVE